MSRLHRLHPKHWPVRGGLAVMILLLVTFLASGAMFLMTIASDMPSYSFLSICVISIVGLFTTKNFIQSSHTREAIRFIGVLLALGLIYALLVGGLFYALING